MRNLTNKEIEIVSGASGYGDTGIGVNVLTVDALNHNDICIGDVLSNNLNDNSFANGNTIGNDVLDILS